MQPGPLPPGPPPPPPPGRRFSRARPDLPARSSGGNEGCLKGCLGAIVEGGIESALDGCFGLIVLAILLAAAAKLLAGNIFFTAP